MRFATSIPQYARDSRFDDDAFRAYLSRVEELWLFESAWTQEQVIGAAGTGLGACAFADDHASRVRRRDARNRPGAYARRFRRGTSAFRLRPGLCLQMR